ncbi:MAG: NINE protein [Lewinella sp.]|nr:NINE protein [Lewinella sp.]
MRNKTVAGLLAFIGGAIGLHRFYLGQIGLGILYIFFFWISWLIGIIDAIVLLSMDETEFNARFNRDFYDVIPRERQRYEPRYEQRRERQERRQERRAPRRAPAPPPPRKENSRPKENTFRKEGIKKFKDYDYEAAIEDFNKALEANPRDIATHFNLACAHSLMEHKDKSFYHLDRAVAMGFDDLERIKTHDALAYLRVQPEFLNFQANGYRLAAAQQAAPQPEADTTQSEDSSTDNDLLAQLNSLREKGLLTEDEFLRKKEKLQR